MRRVLLLLVVAAGCGGKQKSTTPPPPLPEPKAEAPKPAEAPKKEEPPPPAGPISITLEAPKVTTKLVNAGKGKKAPLKIAPKQGFKQQVELALDFRGKTTGGIGDAEDVMHTVVLSGEAEVKAVDKDGNADFQLTVSTTDARTASGASMPLDQAKQVVGSLQGMLISGTIHPDGSTGDIKLSVDKPQQMTQGAITLIKMAMPTLPIVPKEPIANGAKWQVTTTGKLADQLPVTQTTEYQLVSHKGNTWTIKATTKVTGTEQTIDTPAQGQQPATKTKFSKISGKGSLESTITEGALYPTLKTELQTGFTVTLSAADKSLEGTLDMKQGATITPKQ